MNLRERIWSALDDTFYWCSDMNRIGRVLAFVGLAGATVGGLAMWWWFRQGAAWLLG